MQRPPTKGESVVIDTNVIITLTENKHYKKDLSALIEKFEKDGVELIIPRIVEYELLKRADDICTFYDALEYVQSKFTRWEMSEPITKTGIALYALYNWDQTAKELMDQKRQKGQTNSLFHDLIVGSTAMHHEEATGKSTFILSADHDFMRPYFCQEYSWCLRHAKHEKSTMSFHLLRAESQLVIDEWAKYKATLSTKKKT